MSEVDEFLEVNSQHWQDENGFDWFVITKDGRYSFNIGVYDLFDNSRSGFTRLDSYIQEQDKPTQKELGMICMLYNLPHIKVCK